MNRSYWFRIPVSVYAQQLDIARRKLKKRTISNKDVVFGEPIELGSCKSTREEMRRRMNGKVANTKKSR